MNADPTQKYLCINLCHVSNGIFPCFTIQPKWFHSSNYSLESMVFRYDAGKALAGKLPQYLYFSDLDIARIRESFSLENNCWYASSRYHLFFLIDWVTASRDKSFGLVFRYDTGKALAGKLTQYLYSSVLNIVRIRESFSLENNCWYASSRYHLFFLIDWVAASRDKSFGCLRNAFLHQNFDAARRPIMP